MSKQSASLILPGHTIPLTPISSDHLEIGTKYYIRPNPFYGHMHIGTYDSRYYEHGIPHLKFKNVKILTESHNFKKTKYKSESYAEGGATYYETFNKTLKVTPRLLARISEKFHISTDPQHSNISSRISEFMGIKGGIRTKRRSRKSKSTVKNYKK